MDNLTVGQKGTLLVAISVLFQIMIGLFAYKTVHDGQAKTLSEIHARRITQQVIALRHFPTSLSTAVKLYQLNGDKRTKHYCNVLIEEANVSWVQLKSILADRQSQSDENGVQHKNLAKTEEELKRVCDATESILAEKGDELTLRTHLKQFDKEIGLIENTEQKREVTSPSDWENEKRFNLIMFATAFASSVGLSTMLACMLVYSITHRIKVVADNSVRLAANAPLAPSLSGTDEIASLDKRFRSMAQALTQAVDREKAVVSNAMDVICTLDNEGKFRSANPSALRSWGYLEDELVGRRLVSIIESDDTADTNANLQLLLDGEDVKPFENRIRRKDGSIAFALWSVRRGEDNALFCVVHDISERKEIERLKEEFVAMISHDLRTPLNTMQFTLSMAQQGVWGALSDKGNERLSRALNSADRLLNLINQLLDVQKLESGMMEIDKQESSVEAVFEKCKSSLLGFAEKHEVNLEIESTSLRASIDSERIVQVVVNLVSNAVKFSPPRGTVSLSAHEIDDCIEIRVRDEGRGIPEHMLQSIFDRFQQVDRSDERDKKGSGLGLAICRLLVEAHGGTIGVNSTEGEGSTFWFRIPKLQA